MLNISFNKVFTLGALLLSAIYAGAQSKEQIFIQKFNQACQSHEISLLSGDIANNFSVAGITGEEAKYRLEYFLKKQKLNSIEITGQKTISKGTILSLGYKDGTNSNGTTELLLNQYGQLVHFSIADQLYGMVRKKNPKLRAVLPFENKNGSIYLYVKINGYKRPLKLLFDTGADGMAVTEELADAIGLKVTRENSASVVGGNTKIKVSDNNTIVLDTLKIPDMGIAIFQHVRKGSDGIIGNTLLRRFKTYIDYDKNQISLYDFGNNYYAGKGSLVPITMPSGALVLPGQLEIVTGKATKGRFVFDSGASYNLICFRQFVRTNKLLVSGFKSQMQSSTVSMGISSPTFIGNSSQFTIDNLPPITGLPVTLMGASAQNENWQPGVDGSIGNRLLSRYNLTINLAENEIFFSPNHSFGFPKDFILRDYQFGWTNDGKLSMISSASNNESGELIKAGTLIDSIAGFNADKIRKNPELLEKIKTDYINRSIEIILSDKKVVVI
ncbi:MAG: retroviral-like aspartic protease family protein [Sphingobacterium sp.]|jgi:hypothetical protein|nr:retroviral-like aspartic protease family protein [Sphingobacterium sp.]